MVAAHTRAPLFLACIFTFISIPAQCFTFPGPSYHALHRLRSQSRCKATNGHGFWVCSSDATPLAQQLATQAEAYHKVFTKRGWIHVPGFLDKGTCERMLAEAKGVLHSDLAFRSSESHTVYQEEVDEAFPQSHPRNAQQKSSKVIADFDRLPPTSPLKQLYNEPSLLSFVQEVVSPGRKLYLSACPYNSAYYNEYDEGDGLGWHFDKGEFGVNLVLQNPENGGIFEYHPNTRSDSDPWAFDHVERILGGDLSGVDVASDAAAGSLIIFAGRMSLHRVSPVQGKVPRINAILHYYEQPGQKLGEYSLKRFFGRE